MQSGTIGVFHGAAPEPLIRLRLSAKPLERAGAIPLSQPATPHRETFIAALTGESSCEVS
jgi:hypothetical protein